MRHNGSLQKGDDPASRKDLAELRQNMDTRFNQVLEHMRDMQTEILKAFLEPARSLIDGGG
jgi:hypothetical protein